MLVNFCIDAAEEEVDPEEDPEEEQKPPEDKWEPEYPETPSPILIGLYVLKPNKFWLSMVFVKFRI